MIITRNHLPLICSSSLFILILLNQTSQANAHDCSPSSCGTISNISSPFRLKDDPKHCSNPDFKLACENNVTIFPYLHPHKYQVKAINYSHHTIRLADPSITNNTCSFPNHSLHRRDFASAYMPFYPGTTAWPVNFMSCPYPLKNSSLFTVVTHCKTSFPALGRYGYIKIDNMEAWEVKHMCSVDIIVMTSWEFQDSNNVSLRNP